MIFRNVSCFDLNEDTFLGAWNSVRFQSLNRLNLVNNMFLPGIKMDRLAENHCPTIVLSMTLQYVSALPTAFANDDVAICGPNSDLSQSLLTQRLP